LQWWARFRFAHPTKLLRFTRKGKNEAAACDKTTRRANQQNPVQPFRKKYFAFTVGQISGLTPRVSSE
jgi:hypothetical protein